MIFSTHRCKAKSSHNAHKQRDYGYFILSQLSKMGFYHKQSAFQVLKIILSYFTKKLTFAKGFCILFLNRY